MEELEEWRVKEVDAQLTEAWLSGSEEVLLRLIDTYVDANISGASWGWDGGC